MNLAQSLGVVPTARRQTEHEYAASLQAQGKKARRRRQIKKPIPIPEKSDKPKAIVNVKKVAYITNLDQLMCDINRCTNGCFHGIDLSDEE